MDEDRANVYEDHREPLLEKCNISAETYRQRLRQTSTPSGETPNETYNCLKGLYHCWDRPEQRTKEEIGEIIILEQILRVLPYEVRTWVREHELMDGLIAARLATQYQMCVFIANSKAIKHLIALYKNQNFLVFVMCQGRVTLRDNTELSDHLFEVTVNGQTLNGLVDTGSIKLN